MNAIICGTGGRAPPPRNMRSPVGLNQWRLHWLTLLQDLVGLPEFTVLTLQGLDPCLLLARRSGQLACITRGPQTPVPQAERRTAQLRGNCPVGSTVAAVIRTMVAEKPNAARAELGRVAQGVFLVCHEAHRLRVLLSGKPGAVHRITASPAYTRRERKKVEMLFAHLKRILKLGRLRRGCRASMVRRSCAAE